MPFLVANVAALCRFSNDEVATDSSGLRREAFPLARQQEPIEVADENAIELAILERHRHGISLDNPCPRQPSGRDTHHLGALIQADDLASQMLGQKARSARDIQNASGRKAANESYELRDFN